MGISTQTRGIYGPVFSDFTRKNGIDPVEQTQDFLLGVMEALYDEGNKEKLEHCLEELCHMYKIEFRLSDTIKL
jgi:hypothetical protein